MPTPPHELRLTKPAQGESGPHFDCRGVHIWQYPRGTACGMRMAGLPFGRDGYVGELGDVRGAQQFVDFWLDQGCLPPEYVANR